MGVEPGLRTSLERVILKVDLSALVKFEVYLVSPTTAKRFLFATGDARDIELWNSNLDDVQDMAMYELPIVRGYVREMNHEVKITTRSPADAVRVYSDALVAEEIPIVRRYNGMVLRPEFTRGPEVAHGDEYLLAYVLVLVLAEERMERMERLDRLSLLGIDGEEILGVPGDIARLDAATYFGGLKDSANNAYALVLDEASAARQKYADAIRVGGALDMTTHRGVRLELKPAADVPVRMMACSWMRVSSLIAALA